MIYHDDYFQPHERLPECKISHIPAMRIARIRRGKYVMIPPEWRGQIPVRRTIRQRKVRLPREQTVQEQRALTVKQELELV